MKSGELVPAPRERNRHIVPEDDVFSNIFNFSGIVKSFKDVSTQKEKKRVGILIPK